MEIRKNLCFVIFAIWGAGFLVCMALGLGIRFGLFAWTKHQFMPGEEVVLLTGKNHGLFCETVTLESNGYLSGQNIQVRDWWNIEKNDAKVDLFDISLSNKYFDYRKYRLYPNDFLTVRICSEKGLTLYSALSSDAFMKLNSDLQRGSPCPVENPLDDPICGKSILAKGIPAAGKCEWLQPNEDFNQAMIFRGWHEVRVKSPIATDAFVVLSSNNDMMNQGRNLLEVTSYRMTKFDNTVDLISECKQQQQCMFAFDFSANQAVVVQIGNENQELSQPIDVWTYCKPRVWFFVLLFCICPIVILAVITFLVARRRLTEEPFPIVDV